MLSRNTFPGDLSASKRAVRFILRCRFSKGYVTAKGVPRRVGGIALLMLRVVVGASATLHQNNVKLHTFSRYHLGPQTKTGLIFGYGAVDLREMKRGLACLREVLQERGRARRD